MSPFHLVLERPRYADEEATRIAGVVHLLVLALVPLLIVPIVTNLLSGRALSAGILAAEEGMLLVLFVLNRRGAPIRAARLLVLSFWVVTTSLILVAQFGFRDVSMLVYPVLLLTAGLVLNRAFYVGFILLVIGTVVTLGMLEVSGLRVTELSRFTEPRFVVDAVIILTVAGVAVGLLTEDLKGALARARSHEAALLSGQRALEQQAERLATSESRFRSLVEFAVDGIVLSDAEFRIVDVNRRLLELTGYPRADLLGKPLSALFEEERADARAVEDLQAGRTVIHERPLRCADGGSLVAEMSSKRMPDGGYQTFIRDISARRELEEQLRQAQKMEAVGILAGGVAHDFNNILTVIQNGASLLGDEPGATPEMGDYIREIKKAAGRGAALTRQLLTFGRKQIMQRRPCDLRAGVEEFGRMLQRLLGEWVELDLQLGRDPCWILGDLGMIEQAIMNLAVNARDAMPKGGRLTLGLRRTEVKELPPDAPPEARPGSFVQLRVRDTGCGMSPETRQHLFEPFFTTKEVGRGTGLGLATVYGIVTQHEGWIGVDTAPDQGTEFRLHFPSAGPHCAGMEAGAPPLPGDAKASPATLVSRHLLIVEDEPSVRQLLVRALERVGFGVSSAGSADEALRLVEAAPQRFDLLLTDMVMPGGLSGLDLARRCRGLNPKLPAIISSGYSEEMIPPDTLAKEGFIFLPKPYDLQRLRQTVQDLLS